LNYAAAWNIIWVLGFVFGGYGCYLLANNFNKNYLSSIIAGIIFTFTTYHTHKLSVFTNPCVQCNNEDEKVPADSTGN